MVANCMATEFSQTQPWSNQVEIMPRGIDIRNMKAICSNFLKYRVHKNTWTDDRSVGRSLIIMSSISELVGGVEDNFPPPTNRTAMISNYHNSIQWRRNNTHIKLPDKKIPGFRLMMVVILTTMGRAVSRHCRWLFIKWRWSCECHSLP